MSTSDQIRLSLPAEDEYGRLARITAAGLALRLGFSYAEIQDLRLALDEAFISLLQPGDSPGVITVLFEADGDEVTVQATTSAEGPGHQGGETRDEALARLETIVAPLVDHLEVTDDLRHVELTLKRAKPEE